MRKLVLLSAAALCASCSLNLREAQVELPQEYIYNYCWPCDEGEVSARWWEAFEDPCLNSLVELSMRQNHNLAAAMAAVNQSRYYIKVARSTFLPSLEFDPTAELYHELKTEVHEYTVAPTISWEISLFGELRNTKRAAMAAMLQEEWNLRGVWLSLSAEVATSYFTLLQYQRNLHIATRSYELRRTATALVDSMYRYGMSNGTDLMQARSLVYSAQIEMQKYERAVASTALSLSTLVGELPKPLDWRAKGSELIRNSLPVDLPVGLPSSLLERRPDVMKSYYAMVRAAAEVGVSRAERYPSITITGSGGIYATSLEGLTEGNPLYWSATGSLTQPIFSWGALRRKELIEREKYEASCEEYEQTVLEALAEVEKALVTISTYSSQTAATTALVVANARIAENSSALYRSGLGDYLSVIDAERELYASQVSLVEMVAQQYINYIDLFKALGGGVD
ncbi:MAG: efflux transporter outer membrane subunit [Rikenellaceae bacterium]